MFQRKTPKLQAQSKCGYNLFYGDIDEIPKDDFTVTSVDPGIKNLAIRVERRRVDRIETLYFEKINLKYDIKTDKINYEVFSLINDVLDNIKDLLDNCHLFIVERQLGLNYKAIRVSQHIISYFILHSTKSLFNPVVIEISSKLKGKKLNAPPNLNEYGLKRWSEEKGEKILRIRGDRKGLKILETTKGKTDDLTDTILQIEAFCIICELPLTKKRKKKIVIID